MLCGRVGTRRFLPIAGGSSWQCSVQRACELRRRRFLAPLLRAGRKAS
jgi:hypothetical protein